MPKPAAGYSTYDHDGDEGDHSVIQKIVEEHGPAKGHTHRSDGESHYVTTHHEDGHTHHSAGHPHFAHAHEHLAIAHGIA